MTRNYFERSWKALLPARILLARQRKRMERDFKKELAEALATKDLHEVQKIKSTHQHFEQLQGEEEDSYETRQLLTRARRLRVPLPPIHDKSGTGTDDWYMAYQLGERCLTTSGMVKVRDAIRAEQKAKHEGRTRWLAWISALSGLLGIATALVALLARGKS